MMKTKCCGTCQWFIHGINTEGTGFCEVDIGDITKADEFCELYIEDCDVSSEEEE